jgi:hypothetical protein
MQFKNQVCSSLLEDFLQCFYKRDDFVGLWKASALALGKDLSAVYPDFVNTAGTGHQFNVGVQFFFERISQPGSPWQIVSLCTVFYADLHHIPPDVVRVCPQAHYSR